MSAFARLLEGAGVSPAPTNEPAGPRASFSARATHPRAARSRVRALALAALLALAPAAGCGSTPEADPGAESERAALRRVLFDWNPAPAPEELAALRGRAARHVAGPARSARLLAEPDVAHALFVLSNDEAERAQAAAAFVARGESLYAESQRARAAAPLRHDEARAALIAALAGFAADPARARERALGAADSLRALGDRLLAREAELVAFAAALSAGATLEGSAREGRALPPPEPLCRVQAASAAWLTLGPGVRAGATLATARFRAAFEVAARESHWLALQRLESLRGLGAVQLEPTFAAHVSLDVARAALRRGAWLLAVRHALAARRLGQATALGAEARVLLARAYLGEGQPDTALAEAQGALDAAEDLGDAKLAARANGLLGQALLRLSRAEGAAAAFENAATSARRAGDAAALLRHGLNRTNALLKAGQLARADEVFKTFSAPAPGPQHAELAARRSVTEALLLLISRRLRPSDAARRVESALAGARAAGAYEVVEAYAGLVDRLRSRASKPG